ncbi:ATP-binding protein [Klebsiella aerogenes]|uniref:hybrid sensor histidine kinase/response regulator n=1 Tax=Klebsiella aerogenes TaxID=548 RepID=UPI002E31D969|nr:ATP-binding protein [Klebsiella aerogenes]MED7793149.1 ATP-binding protein [Klebsiella aerogenes]
MKNIQRRLTITILGLVCIVLIFSSYKTYQSTSALYDAVGTQENYAWAVAKFSIKLAEFSEAVNSDGTAKDIRSRLDILFSRVNVIRNHTSSTQPLYREKGYTEVINSIYDKMTVIDSFLNSSPPDLDAIASEIRAIKPLTIRLANIADHAEVAQRSVALDRVKEKRRISWWLMFSAGALFIVMCMIFIIVYIRMQRIAAAERQAVINKNAFLGVVGHELRSSLQTIISSIDLLLLKNKESTSGHLFKRLENAALKMERQMTDLAEFARIDNGEIQLYQSTFCLKDCLMNVLMECQERYQQKNISLITNIETTIITSDMSRIMQITENLVTNAFKYTTKGEISVSGRIIKNEILAISVKDTGQGISKKSLKLINKPFVRQNSDDKIPGFGMGLAIVSGIVKIMGGSIKINSEEHFGTEIQVKIPVKTEYDIQAGAANTFPAPENFNTDANILIVDDNHMVCKALAESLQEIGYNVEYSTDPGRAYMKLKRKPYDIILSDLQMPLISGVELYEKTRSESKINAKTPYVFISAHIHQSPVEGIPLLSKPVRLDELNTTIQNILSIR